MTEKQAIEILARNVNAELNRRNWDPAELARRAGVDRKTIYPIVNACGACTPRFSTLIGIAAALDMEPAELLSGPTHEIPTSAEILKETYERIYRRERDKARKMAEEQIAQKEAEDELFWEEAEG